MDILRFLFGSGWLIAWYVAMWLFAAMLVALPVHALAKDALKVPPPASTLGTMGAMLLPLFFFGVVLTINGALAVRGMDWSIWGRAIVVMAINMIGLGLLCGVFAVILHRPGMAAVVFMVSASGILMLAALVLMWMGRHPVPGSMGSVILTIVLAISEIVAVLFVLGVVMELRRR